MEPVLNTVYVVAALAVCSLAAVIWYLLVRLTGLVEVAIVDNAMIGLFNWILHLVL
ncbi:hypothetical protein [Sulfitobacter mediterraneus]|uniref:hypothetical protein n=1 Tax=Sulfitobacter mediterraneus TaxID=83219 RepID=UPI0021A86601|nr:hypothetical protein [Sulfitobacter mediterraneus]UWR10604.1 hypothetical protein K3753_15325 [Sulfitobacter mediterraneus]UWR10613.1 hypothetical protein K3753_15370 [Sulfitobacter mediterraneus]